MTTEENSQRRVIASNYLQAVRAKGVAQIYDWLPPAFAAEIVERTDIRVEEEGQLEEDVEFVCSWFQSDEDAQWLDAFWKTRAGGRYLELSIALMMRAMTRELRRRGTVDLKNTGE